MNLNSCKGQALFPGILASSQAYWNGGRDKGGGQPAPRNFPGQIWNFVGPGEPSPRNFPGQNGNFVGPGEPSPRNFPGQNGNFVGPAPWEENIFGKLGVAEQVKQLNPTYW